MLNTILLTLMDDRVKIFIVGEEELVAAPDIVTFAVAMKPSPLSVLDLEIQSITSMMAKKKGMPPVYLHCQQLVFNETDVPEEKRQI